MTILAFDTATSFGAVCGLASGGRAREARAGDLLAAVDRLVDDPGSIERIVVGRGPGSFTSIRIGLAMARSLAMTLGIPVAGASTLDAYAGATPVIDARRGEVFTSGPRVCRPEELDVAGRTLVGDGAVRYREVFERGGAHVPADEDPVHLPDPLLLLEHAFKTLEVGRVQLKTDVRNVRSQQAIARLGARYEGTLRRYQQRADGTMRDTVMFSVTAEEWPRVREGLRERLPDLR
jgi:tRNA threonylcarbamoyl adenosine modification protein YeaZ